MATNTNISPQQQCLSERDLLALAQNRLSKHEAAVLKAHIAQCELCADALEGVRLMDDPDKLPHIIAYLDQDILGKSTAKPKIIRFPSAALIGIAASICLLIGYFFLLPTANMEKKSMAVADEAPVEQEAVLPEEDAEALKKEEFVEGEAQSSSVTQNHVQKTEVTKQKQTVEEPRPQERVAKARKEASSAKDETKGRVTSESKLAEATAPPAPVETEEADDLIADNTAINDDGIADFEAEEAAGNAMSESAKLKKADMQDSKNGVQAEKVEAVKYALPAVQMNHYEHPDFNRKQNKWMRQGMDYFNEGDLDNAKEKFSALLQEMPQSRIANYLAGINYLYLNQPLKARECLMIVAKRQGELAFESVDWPSILQLLKNGQNEEAKRLLQTYTQREGLIMYR